MFKQRAKKIKLIKYPAIKTQKITHFKFSYDSLQKFIHLENISLLEIQQRVKNDEK